MSATGKFADEILATLLDVSKGKLSSDDVAKFADLALDLATERAELLATRDADAIAEHRGNIEAIERSFKIRISRLLLDAPNVLTEEVLPAILRTIVRILLMAVAV